SWSFGAEVPVPTQGGSAQAPTTGAAPAAPVEVVIERASEGTGPAADEPTLPWYHPSVVGRLAIVALTMTLVALRINGWRAARATGTAAGAAPSLDPRDGTP